MPISCGRDSSHPAESRSVTSADVDWLALPASQEIPHSYAQSFHQAPDPTARPQLRRTPQVAAAVRTGELLQFNGAQKVAAVDSGVWAASDLHLPNAFQHLMKKSKAAKYLKKEQRSAIFRDR
jgi:hypothetical protein